MVELMFHIVSRFSMPNTSGTQSIDRAAQLLVRGRRERRADRRRRAGRGHRAAQEHGVAARGRARAAGARPARQRPRPAAARAGDDAPRPPRRRRPRPGRARRPTRCGALAEASGETINLAVPTPLGVEHLSQVDSGHFIGSTNWIGRRVPHHDARRSARSSWPSAPSGLARDARRAARPSSRPVRARGYATADRRARARPGGGGRARARRRRRRGRRALDLRARRAG